MARSFDGSSQYITAAIPTTAVDNVTLSVWFLVPAGTPAGFGTYFYDGSGGGGGWGMGVSWNTGGSITISVDLVNVGSGGSTDSGGNTGSWISAQIRRTSGTWALFRNGTKFGGNTNSPNAAPSGVFGIASREGASNFFPGYAADVAIWNAALSDLECIALAKGVRPGWIRPGSLKGWWPIDGLQSPEPDLSGFANNGTVAGSPPKIQGPPFMMFTPRWKANVTPFDVPLPPEVVLVGGGYDSIVQNIQSVAY